jgi:hypothetical protein
MRAATSYLDFDLRIIPAGGGYRAQVLSSPAGEATADFTLPFSDMELENFVLRIGRPRRGTRRIDSPEMEAVKLLGRGLFDAVFSGDVRACWRSSLSEADAQDTGLRLRLHIADAPELNDVPWEYLYNASLNRFLSLSEHTPLIRYLDLPERIRPLAIGARLEILVVISSPSDYPGLDVEYEWSRLNEALVGLVDTGQVRLERLADARLLTLQRALRRGEYHILHFIGHGGFDPGSQAGVVVLCDETGKGRRVTAEHLGTILHDHRSLRLVLLNACEGSRTSRTDPFAGVAQTLVQQGVPAVIAMQFEITDQAAIIFADEFYAAAADGYPVDAALAAARKAIFAGGNDIEWGTPVLYLRAPDGRLFSVDRSAARQAEEERQRAAAARQAEEERQRAEAARQAEEERQRAEAARQAEEERQRAEAARQAEEERRRAAAARQVEERQRAEAARQVEEEKRRAEAARQAAAARQAEEERRRATAKRRLTDIYGSRGMRRIPAVAPIALEVGRNLVPLVISEGNALSQQFLELFDIMRDDLRYELGIEVPAIRVRGNELDMPAGSYLIMMNEIPLVMGDVDENRALCNATVEELRLLDVEAETAWNPANGAECAWVQRKDWEKVLGEGTADHKDDLRLWKATEYLILHLSSVIWRNAAEFVGVGAAADLIRAESQELYNRIRAVRGGLTAFTEILRTLLDELVPIKSISVLCTKYLEMVDAELPFYEMIEEVRCLDEIRRAPCRKGDTVPVYNLGTRFVETIERGIIWSGSAAILSLEPEAVQDALSAVRAELGRLPPNAPGPSILVKDWKLRRPIRKLVQIEWPHLRVLARRELSDLDAAAIREVAVIELE